MNEGKIIEIPCTAFVNDSLRVKVDSNNDLYFKWYNEETCKDVIKPNRDSLVKLRDFLNEYLRED